MYQEKEEEDSPTSIEEYMDASRITKKKALPEKTNYSSP